MGHNHKLISAHPGRLRASGYPATVVVRSAEGLLNRRPGQKYPTRANTVDRDSRPGHDPGLGAQLGVPIHAERPGSPLPTRQPRTRPRRVAPRRSKHLARASSAGSPNFPPSAARRLRPPDRTATAPRTIHAIASDVSARRVVQDFASRLRGNALTCHGQGQLALTSCFAGVLRAEDHDVNLPVFDPARIGFVTRIDRSGPVPR